MNNDEDISHITQDDILEVLSNLGVAWQYLNTEDGTSMYAGFRELLDDDDIEYVDIDGVPWGDGLEIYFEVLKDTDLEELETLEPLIKQGIVPNLVTDIFKVRSGQWTQVRIWSQMNLGTLKKKDLFITDSRLEPIDDFFENDYYKMSSWSDEEKEENEKILEKLNEGEVIDE